MFNYKCSLTYLGPFWQFSFPKEPVTTTEPLLDSMKDKFWWAVWNVILPKELLKTGALAMNGKHVQFWTQGDLPECFWSLAASRDASLRWEVFPGHKDNPVSL